MGCPIANLHSARSDLWEPQFVLRPTQLRKKHCFVKSTSNDLTAVGITTCLPSELTSSLRIGEFPCRLLRTKNHHFAALRFPDFQRGALEWVRSQILVRVSGKLETLLNKRLFVIAYKQSLYSGGQNANAQPLDDLVS